MIGASLTDEMLIEHIFRVCGQKNLRAEKRSCAGWHSYLIHAPDGQQWKALHAYDTQRAYRIIMWRPGKTVFIATCKEYFDQTIRLGCEAAVVPNDEEF